MRLTSWLTSVRGNLSNKRGGAKRRKRRAPCRSARQVELLQLRAMLSSVTFDGTSMLDISLDGSDSVSAQVVGGQVEVSINGTPTGPTPNASDVYFISVTGGPGDNLIDLSGLTAADFSYLLTSTSISGGDGNDTIYGSGVMDDIRGDAGDDSIDGGGGMDNIQGDDGADVLNGGEDSDSLWGGEGDDTLWSGSGAPDDGLGLDGECGLDTLDGVVDESDECGGGSGSGAGGGSPPSITNPGNQSSFEGDSTVSLQITATDPDLPADTLSYSATGLPVGLIIDPMTGVISGQIDLTAFEQGPVYNVTVTVTDSSAVPLTASAAFQWTITNAGPASVTATEFLNPTTSLPNSVTSTGVSPVEKLYIENGHSFELKANGVVVPPGLAPINLLYRIGNSTTPPAPTGNFGAAATATPMITPAFPEPVPMLIVYVGLDFNLDGIITANEETQKLEVHLLTFGNNDPLLEVKAQRVLPVALQENLFPVKEGEMFETGGLEMDTTVSPPVAVPSVFRFELTGPEMGNTNMIRWEVTRADGSVTYSGNGNDFTGTFSGSGPLSVRFFLDRNSNLTKDAGEPEKISPTFQVVNSVTHSLTFEFSSILTAGAVGLATPAQRLAAAQSRADAEDNVLQVKDHADDWRTPVKFSLTPSAAGGVFTVGAARPDVNNASYDSNLHIAAPHDITFTKWMTTCAGDVAHGCTGSTGSVIWWGAPSLTFVHELGHLYGRVDGWAPGNQGHTPQTLEYNGYLMHPGPGDEEPEDVGDIGGILEKEDADRFYQGNKI